ncbi:MAG: segregation/condensation protein A [Myxococcales bacterium]|jgi:segregation and condensation protein A|nr:segregation/condensation protein A [Myxococcales bacterium]
MDIPPRDPAHSGAPPAIATPSLAFQLVLPNFEGPLDLLLHLIREHRIDILDIPIALITEKYLETLRAMKELDLDIAGEFVLMAATLAHIKSRILLPEAEADPEELAPQADPREELVRRLLAYQKYRAAAESLGTRALLGRQVFTRRARLDAVPRPEGELGLIEVSVFKLIETLAKVLKERTPEPQHEVRIEQQLNLGDTMGRVIAMLQKTPRTSFVTLLQTARDRVTILMTFLAILEMCKMRLLRIVQEEGSDDILVAAPAPEALTRAAVLFKDDYQ